MSSPEMGIMIIWDNKVILEATIVALIDLSALFPKK